MPIIFLFFNAMLIPAKRLFIIIKINPLTSEEVGEESKHVHELGHIEYELRPKQNSRG